MFSFGPDLAGYTLAATAKDNLSTPSVSREMLVH